MPIATVQTPDGKTMTLEVPEGATQDQIIAFAEANYTPQSAPQQPEQPAPSFYDRLRAGISGSSNVAAELGGGAFNAVASTVDIIPEGINAGLRLAGAETQIPTLQETAGPYLGNSYMQPGMARDAVNAAGSTLVAAGGLASVPRNVATAGGAAAEFFGIGSASPVGRVVSAAEFPIDTLTDAAGKKLSLLRNTGDVSVAGLMLDDAGNVVKDASQKAAMKQGFDPGFVAMVKSANPDTRSKMSAMLDIVEKGKQNFRYSGDNRPLNVIGDSVLNRIKVVKEANRVAGVRLDSVADALKGEQVDASPAVDSFLKTLDDMGMRYDPATKKLNLVQGSSTQDMPKVHKEAARILNRLQTTRQDGVMDGYDIHVMKKWIDNNVDYAKNSKGKTGMIGSLDRAIKGLRHDLDSALDSQFPEYNKINTQYAETRGALDSVQEIAGRKFDPNDESAAMTMGSLSRRFLSNAQSNGYLRDAVSELDSVARKYIKPGTDLVPYQPIQRRSGVTPAMLEEDDLIGLALYADELDKTFGAASRTSLMGDTEKVANAAIDAGLGQMTAAGMAASGAKGAYKKLRGINEKNAIKAMRELLQRGNP